MQDQNPHSQEPRDTSNASIHVTLTYDMERGIVRASVQGPPGATTVATYTLAAIALAETQRYYAEELLTLLEAGETQSEPEPHSQPSPPLTTRELPSIRALAELLSAQSEESARMIARLKSLTDEEASDATAH